MSDLRERIAAIHKAHVLAHYSGSTEGPMWVCHCGIDGLVAESHDLHVADALTCELSDNPWCCASDKLQANMDGFDAGHLTALKSVKYMVRALSKEDALEVIDELIQSTELRKAENE